MASNHYEFTAKANEDLDSILNYIAIDLCNPAAAKRFFEHVFNNLDRLCLFPESCTLVENEFVKRKDIRKSVIDHFLMYYVYDTDSSAIIVLRLVYGRRDLNEILKSM